MNSSPKFEHEQFARRHRGGMLLERLGLDLYPHPFLGFTPPPGHRSDVINFDAEGFRLSHSPFGTVDSSGWLAAGGGGIVLGNSVAMGLAASSDRATPASHLAYITGIRQLNLALCGAISVQEIAAAVPFLDSASTVVIIGGGTEFINLLGSLTPDSVFGVVSFERTFAEIEQVPVFDLADLAAGKTVTDLGERRHSHRTPRRWHISEAMSRTEECARKRLRDMAVLSRAAGPETRVLFCLQPLATPRTRRLTPEERERFDFDAPVFGILQSTAEECWTTYCELLAKGCAEIGVRFLNLSADQFEGDSFADIVHFNDDGNRQAAELIKRALEIESVATGSV